MASGATAESIRGAETYPGVALLDFFKQDCGPCALMDSTIRGLEHDAPRVIVVKIDVDEFPTLAAKYRVVAFPTFVILNKGAIRNVITGRVPGAKLRDALTKAGT